MPPMYRFMTGANQYRIRAKSREEAIQTAFAALNPTEDAKQLILSTLYDEEDAQKYTSHETYEERRKRMLPNPTGSERRSCENTAPMD